MKLRVLTYNIHRAIGVDRAFKPQRIAEILRHHDADVVLLQEVDEGVPRSRELNLAKELAEILDYPYYAFGHNVSLRKGRYGNATLSRHPLERERNIDLTVGRRKRRGCQHTTIRIENGFSSPHRLEVFNLHLGLSATERRQQAGLLAASGELNAAEQHTACLLGGDFNDWRSALHPFFEGPLGFQCATLGSGSNGDRCFKTYPSFSPRGPLDRIYYRGPLRLVSSRRCRMGTSKVASDHLPIIAEFELQ